MMHIPTVLIAALLATPLMIAGQALADGKGSDLPTYTPDNSLIILLDHQKTTVDWVRSLPKETMIQNIRMLARLNADLGIPLIVTSTMEAQVGLNIQDIQDLVPTPFANRIKRGGTINAFNDPAFAKAVKATGKKNLILAGLTTDICLFHTSEGALRNGYNVWVVADASGSMTQMADQLTFDYLRSHHVTISSANSILTELYGDFGTPEGGKAAKINMEEVIAKLKPAQP